MQVYRGERTVLIVPDVLMGSKRVMLMRLDEGMWVQLAATGQMIHSLRDVPCGKHCVVTTELGARVEGHKEYHLIRDVRKDKNGAWRAMSRHELGVENRARKGTKMTKEEWAMKGVK